MLFLGKSCASLDNFFLSLYIRRKLHLFQLKRGPLIPCKPDETHKEQSYDPEKPIQRSCYPET